MPKLIFKADLPALLNEAARLLLAVDEGSAGLGLIQGFMVALSHLKKLAERAAEIGDPGLLLRLYALGIVGNPIEFCKEQGTWNDTYSELAAELGLLGGCNDN